MTQDQLDAINAAVELIQSSTIKRVDAETFIAYRVGNVIRIDVKQDKE